MCRPLKFLTFFIFYGIIYIENKKGSKKNESMGCRVY